MNVKTSSMNYRSTETNRVQSIHIWHSDPQLMQLPHAESTAQMKLWAEGVRNLTLESTLILFLLNETAISGTISSLHYSLDFSYCVCRLYVV